MKRAMRSIGLACLVAALAASAADAQKAPAEIPQTEVNGRDRVVITGMVPVPDVGRGAPLLTSRDVEAIEETARQAKGDAERDFRRCSNQPFVPIYDPSSFSLANLLAGEYEASKRMITAADRARATTEKAEAARQDAAAGYVDMKVVNDTELARQEAVMKLQEARAGLAEMQAMIGDFQDMALGQRGRFMSGGVEFLERAMRRQKENVGIGVAKSANVPGLDIRNVRARQVTDRKGKDLVLVEGDLFNLGDKAVKIPALSAALIDDRGWVLTNTTVEPAQKKSLPAGKTQAFRIEMRPAPELLKAAVVTIAAETHAEPRLGVGAFCWEARLGQLAQ